VDYDRLGSGYLPRTICLNAISSIAGVPQISLPCSTASGLPMGFSLIGAAGADRELVKLGSFYERLNS
jgi:Asp-tRNA(Asn)/Glu-tRNA(Gln) amidotransferase A subunit family amidase